LATNLNPAMTKTKNKSAAAKVAALSPEEFQKLTPEEQAAEFAKLHAAHAAASEQLNGAQAAAKKAESKLKAAVKGSEKEEMPSFEVDADKKNGIEGGEYQFTTRTFTHGGKVLQAKKVVEAAEGEEDDPATIEAMAVLSALVDKKSGIIRLKGKED
jgi:excinuclease UvrABC nuclease subunit